jgi:hypothetical protein
MHQAILVGIDLVWVLVLMLIDHMDIGVPHQQRQCEKAKQPVDNKSRSGRIMASYKNQVKVSLFLMYTRDYIVNLVIVHCSSFSSSAFLSAAHKS